MTFAHAPSPAARALAVAALLALPAATALGQDSGGGNPPPPLAAGTRAPDFALPTLRGKPITLRSLRGRVVLIDYWATWCGPCQIATPTLVALQRRFGPKQLRVVGISMDADDTVGQVPGFVRQFKVNYTITASPDLDHEVAAAYRVDGIPSQFLIDKRGIVRWSQSGYSYGEGDELAGLIRRLNAERS